MPRLSHLVALVAVFAIAGLHQRGGRNTGGPNSDQNQPGPNRRTPSGANPPIGGTIQQAADTAIHARPGQTYQIGNGIPVTRLKPTNRKNMRNTDPTGDPYQGGWHGGHSNLNARGVESNHVPPQQIMDKVGWQYHDGKPWSKSHASAIELDYEDHRIIGTTGSGADKVHLQRVEDAVRRGDMEEALALEIQDLKSKLAYHNTQEMVDPNYSPNPHQRPYKSPDRYDDAFKGMIRECYPDLVGSPKLQDLIGPF